jgi:hypothetical protein
MSNQLQISGAAKIRSIQGPVVANSGVISALNGAATQYVRGDGTLADFPTSTGGGSSVSYYLNTSVSQGTIGGVAYKQLSKVPISGAGTDVTISANGYIASYITDANDPSLLEVPAGNFNCEFYFSVNSNAHNPYVYAELYKYNGSTFTLLGSNQAIPEYLTNGTTLSAYYFAIPVAVAALTVTDRLAIRIYVNVDGRTVTLHTENNHLCQVVTTFSKGLISLNNLTRQNQFFATGTSGTDFNISSATATHTFNLPIASATNTGKLSSTDWSTFNGKVPYSGATADVNLGGNSLIANKLTANGSAGSSGSLHLKQNDTINVAGVNYGTIATNTLQQFVFYWENVSAAKRFNLDFSLLTPLGTAKTFYLPDLSGTIALTSNLSSYVPYSGATANVDLGIYSLVGHSFNARGQGTSGGVIALKQNGQVFASTGYAYIGSESAGKLNIYFGDTGLEAAILDNSLLTADRTYNLPNASGTLALTSNLSSYVPYTGATANVDLGIYNLTAAVVTANSLIQVNNTTTGDSVIAYQNQNVTKWKIGNVYNAGANSFSIYNNGLTTNAISISSTTNTISLIGSAVFSNNIYSNIGNIALKQNIGTATTSTYLTLNASSTGSTIESLIMGLSSGNVSSLNFSTSSNYGYTFPSASGTIALTSDLSGYVPYTGATTNVNLATRTLTANILTATGIGVNIDGDGSNGGALNLKNYNSISSAGVGYTSIFAQASDRVVFNLATASGIKYVAFLFNSLAWNSQRYYDLPNADGTLALTSNLSAYLPLTGGTLTGGLYINPTNTATVGLDVASNTTRFRSDNLEGFKRQLEITMGSGTLVQCVAKGFGANYGTDLAFYTATTGGVNGSPAIYITGTNNRVGIKTGTPAYDLDVSGTGRFTSTLLVSGAATLTGNVGIGGAASGTYGTLSVFGGISTKDDNNGKLEIGRYSSGAANSYIKIGTNSNSLRITNAADSADLVTFTNAGNVGIGVSPFAWDSGTESALQVKAASIYSYGNYELGLQENAYYNSNSWKYMYSTSATQMQLSSGEIIFRNAASGSAGATITWAERMRITSAGRLLLNTTSSTQGMLYSVAGANTDGITSQITTAGYTAFVSIVPSGSYSAYWVCAGNTAGYIDHPTNTTTRYYTGPSDERLKSNIKNWDENVLDLFKDINPKTYNHNIDNDESIVYKGFIAQEMVDKFPEAYGKDREGFYSFNPSGYIPYLVKAIQELSKQNEELSNRLIKLESK